MTPSAPTPAARALRRPTRLVAVGQAAALSLLVAGVAGWVALDRTVTLEVDGEAQQVRILGSEVADVLAAAELEVGARDLVSPALEESIRDGGTVTVRYARPLTVADPTGGEQTYWTTELSVDEALAAAGLRTQDAWLSTSRSAAIGRGGMSLTMSVPKDVTVVADGTTEQVTSPAPTVADLLDELDLDLDADDRVSPGPSTPLAAGRTVTVERLATRRVVETEEVAFATRTVEDDGLFAGQSEVRAAGAPGEREVAYRVVTVDGEVGVKQEISRTTTTAPVDRVVAEGTRERPAPEPAATPQPRSEPRSEPARSGSSGSSSGSSGSRSSSPAPSSSSSTDSLNWAALAACESGGSPTIVSGNGLYHGLYQFSTSTWRAVGGSGDASDAPPSEQTARAKALYDRAGVGQWPHCGPRLYS